jgi:hypothetical protein
MHFLAKEYCKEIHLVEHETVLELAPYLKRQVGIDWVIMQALWKGEKRIRAVEDASAVLNDHGSAKCVQILAVAPSQRKVGLCKQFLDAGAHELLYVDDVTWDNLKWILSGTAASADAFTITSFRLAPGRRHLTFGNGAYEFHLYDLPYRYVRLLTYLAIARQEEQFDWFKMTKHKWATVSRIDLWAKLDILENHDEALEPLTQSMRALLTNTKAHAIDLKSMSTDIADIDARCREEAYMYRRRGPSTTPKRDRFLLTRYSRDPECLVLAETIEPANVVVDFS